MHRPDFNQQTKKLSIFYHYRKSDFHKLTVNLLKSYFKKLEPKKLIYCDFKKFSNQ